jgi:hypothetical protein
VSRKDYVALAAAIRSQAELEFDAGKRQAIIGVALAISRALANDNPRFDTARFLTAAGVY